MMQDYVLLTYIAVMLSPYLWLIRPSVVIPKYKHWFYRHCIVVLVVLAALGTYRYNFPLVLS